MIINLIDGIPCWRIINIRPSDYPFIAEQAILSNKNGFDYKSFTFLLRGSYHLYLGRNYSWLDPFVAAGIGFHSLKGTPLGDNNIFEPNKGGFAYSVMFGANI